MVNGVIIPTSPIEKLPSTQNLSVSEIHPQVVFQVTLVAFPTGSWNFDSVIQLQQFVSISNDISESLQQ